MNDDYTSSIEELCRMLEDYRDNLEIKEGEISSLKKQLRELKYENKVLRVGETENLSRIRLLEDSLTQVVQELESSQLSLEVKEADYNELLKRLERLESKDVEQLENDTLKSELLIVRLREENLNLKNKIKERDEIIESLDTELNLQGTAWLNNKLETAEENDSSQTIKYENPPGKNSIIGSISSSDSPPPKFNHTKQYDAAEKSLPLMKKETIRKASLESIDNSEDEKMDSEFASAVLNANQRKPDARRGDSTISANKYRYDGSNITSESDFSRRRKSAEEKVGLSNAIVPTGRHRYVCSEEAADLTSYPLPLPPRPPSPPFSSYSVMNNNNTHTNNNHNNDDSSHSMSQTKQKSSVLNKLSKMLYSSASSSNPNVGIDASASLERAAKDDEASPARGKLTAIYQIPSELDEEECKMHYFSHPSRFRNISDDQLEEEQSGQKEVSVRKKVSASLSDSRAFSHSLAKNIEPTGFSAPKNSSATVVRQIPAHKIRAGKPDIRSNGNINTKESTDQLYSILERMLVFTSSISLLVTIVNSQTFKVTSPPTWRKVLNFPFSNISIWNLPIGSSANYVAAGISPTANTAVYNDPELLFLDTSQPSTSIYLSSADWTSASRCIADTPLQTLLTAPFPPTFYIPDQPRQNYPATFLLSDQSTVRQGQPLAHCSSSQKVTIGGILDPNFLCESFFNNNANNPAKESPSIYGTGFYGAHGGTCLSAFGGSLRLGELIPDSNGIIQPVRHALKINIQASLYFYYKPGMTYLTCYFWPAIKCDGSSFAGYYGGKNQYLGPGSLLALSTSLNINNIGLTSQPGLALAWTLQNYGAYVVDDAGWDGISLATEQSTAGEYTAQFGNAYGFTFESGANNENNWTRDFRTIMKLLSVVTNWNAATYATVAASNGAQGAGGGAALQPWAPPFHPPASTTATTASPSAAPAKPISPSSAPVKPTFQPISPSSAPVKPTFQPIAPSSAPVKPTFQPISPSAAPAAKPISPTAAPLLPSGKPIAAATPSAAPKTPSASPTSAGPTIKPVTKPPTIQPTVQPTAAPFKPTSSPTSKQPHKPPTSKPHKPPTHAPAA